MKGTVAKGSDYKLISDDGRMTESESEEDNSTCESDTDDDDSDVSENKLDTDLLMPDMALDENDGSDLFKFARELYIAAASSALQGIPECDGSLTRKQIHQSLKAAEVNEVYMFLYAISKQSKKNLSHDYVVTECLWQEAMIAILSTSMGINSKEATYLYKKICNQVQ